MPWKDRKTPCDNCIHEVWQTYALEHRQDLLTNHFCEGCKHSRANGATHTGGDRYSPKEGYCDACGYEVTWDPEYCAYHSWARTLLCNRCVSMLIKNIASLQREGEESFWKGMCETAKSRALTRKFRRVE